MKPNGLRTNANGSPPRDDRAFVASLMGRVVEPGRFANWIAPPATGINKQPVDFPVRPLNCDQSGSAPMRFADFHAGQVIHCGPASLSERQITDYARRITTRNGSTPTSQRAAASTWQGLIASGWQTCGVAMRMACDEILARFGVFRLAGACVSQWENRRASG